MNVITTSQNPTMTEEPSLFDSLARLVPEELQAAYYRVVAHTHTLAPDDEMLRILEAMGILTLVTRHTPADIAVERERFQEMLKAHFEATTDVERGIAKFGESLDHRLIHLPREIEAGLNPQQISKLLGETLRQQFAATGVQETASSLEQSVSAMRESQKKLTSALAEITDHRFGVAARIENANRIFDQIMESRAARMDAFLKELRKDFLRIWLPIIACGALLIGFTLGRTIQSWQDEPAASKQTVSAPAFDNPAPTPKLTEPPASVGRRSRR